MTEGMHRTRPYGEIWADSARFAAPITSAVVIVLAIAIGGGTGLIQVGLACAALGSIAVTSAVAFFRYDRGARGFPRRTPIQPGDHVGDWLILDHIRSELRPDGAYVVRRGDEYGVLKVGYHTNSSDRDPTRRAEREGDYLKRIRSSHVVQCLDHITTNDYSVLITSYLGEQTLWDRRQQGDVGDAELYSVAAGVIKGLADAHGEGITHRDVTPRNVMVDDVGAATLIDLGIAVSETTTRLTKTHAQIFTIGYKAPEQFRGPPTSRSDVFAWAATIYYLSTGEEAFPGDAAEAQGKITTRTPDLAACPKWLKPVLTAAFERDPDRRPDAAATLALLDASNPSRWPRHVAQPMVPARTWRLPSWATPTAVASLFAIAVTIITLQAVESSRDTVATTAEPTVAGAGPSQAPSTEAAPVTTNPEATLVPTTLPTTEPPAPTAAPTTASPPPPPAAAFLGVWSGTAQGSGGNTFPLTYVLDQPQASQPNDIAGNFVVGGGSCGGQLIVIDVDGQLMGLEPRLTYGECTDGGRADLEALGGQATVRWNATDGSSSSFATLELVPDLDPTEEVGWPTSGNEAGSKFAVLAGVCAAGGSSPPCSPTGGLADWTTCSESFCLAGYSPTNIEIIEASSLDYILTVDSSARNAITHLILLGVSPDEAVTLIR